VAHALSTPIKLLFTQRNITAQNRIKAAKIHCGCFAELALAIRLQYSCRLHAPLNICTKTTIEQRVKNAHEK
jgi:hypothetical protein